MGKAIKQRWDIPPEVFSKLPKRVADMALKDKSPRNALAAGRLLVDMSMVNPAIDSPGDGRNNGPQLVIDDAAMGVPDPDRLPSLGEDYERVMVPGQAVFLPLKHRRPEGEEANG